MIFCIFVEIQNIYQYCRIPIGGCLMVWIFRSNFTNIDATAWKTLEIKNTRLTNTLTNYCMLAFPIFSHGTNDSIFYEFRSISGVIVLQRRCFFQSLPSNLFPPELLLNMRRYMMNKFYHSDHFDSQQLVAVKNILSVSRDFISVVNYLIIYFSIIRIILMIP